MKKKVEQISFKARDIISIQDLTREEILYLMEKGKDMYTEEQSGNRYTNSLGKKVLFHAFYQDSTRTINSFNAAMQELGGIVRGFSGKEGTSVMKKECIRDTIVMAEATHADIIVMRHPKDGSVQWAADVAHVPVINGGDGTNEHPTQALLDLFTMYLINNDKLDNVNVGIGGDLAHGRTIRSLCAALSNFDDITIRWAADDILGMPDDVTRCLKKRNVAVIRHKQVKDVLRQVMFYYMTRPQFEMMSGNPVENQKKILKLLDVYRITLEKITGHNFKLMHPLPVNSETREIDYQVYFSAQQHFFTQAENGVFMRKALLDEILEGTIYERFTGILPDEIRIGNNRLKRRIKARRKEGRFIDNIHGGIVLDHLMPKTEDKVKETLKLACGDCDIISAYLHDSDKSFVKTSVTYLDERGLKMVCMCSPDPTVNIIHNGHVHEKYVYLLCRNDNCITRVLEEDVPPRFYKDDGNIKCRYCRHTYEVSNPNMAQFERKHFLATLPSSVIPVGK